MPDTIFSRGGAARAKRPRPLQPLSLPGLAFGCAGRFFFQTLERLSDQAGFAGRVLLSLLGGHEDWGRLTRLLLAEIYSLVAASFLLIILVGFMLGFLWAFLWYGALSSIGGLESIGFFLLDIHAIQIAPIMVTVIVIMRYGAPITWELAIMKAGGDFERLKGRSVSPELHLAAPRIGGAFLAMPALLALFMGASFAGAYYMAWREDGQAAMEFIITLSQKTGAAHFAVLAFKSLVISLTVPFFCVYNAFSMETGALGRGGRVMRLAMGEAFFYSVLSSVLVSVFYSV